MTNPLHNGEARPFPTAGLHQCATLGQIILTAIKRFEHRPAIADGNSSWTYGQLGEAIGRCIEVYKQFGMKCGEGVAMASQNRVEQVAAQYAALLLGLRYTALHLLSARDVHEFILNDAGISMLIIEPGLAANSANYRAAAPTLRTVLSFGSSPDAEDLIALMNKSRPHTLFDQAEAEGIAYLFYTGGTTGRPKGVMLGHRSLVTATLIQCCDWDLAADDLRFLAATPTSHASGIILPTIFMRGGYARLTSGFEPIGFCHIVEQERINCTFIVPTMLYVLLDSPASRNFDLTSLHTVIYGAAPMSPERMREALERFGPIFVQLYGQTEVPMCISALRKTDHDPDRPDRLGSAGLPCPSVQLKLFDPAMKEVPDGEPGEICVRGPLVMDGYWQRDEATAEAFRGGWHHTGDVAIRTPAGFLKIVDRTSDLIITGGFNVYPREVEDALATHPAVSAAAVVGLPDDKWGEAVTAFVVLREGKEAVCDEIKAHVRELRGAIATPKSVRIVDSLPVTPLGKIDRRSLRAQFSEAR